MSPEMQLAQLAIQISNDIQESARPLKRELEQIEARKLEIEMQLHTADLARERPAHFKAKIGRDFQCPRCWIRNEMQSILRPISSLDENDKFQCGVCHLEFQPVQ